MSIQGTIILKDVQLYWPFLTKKNELAGKYTVDISALTKEHIKAISNLGLNESVLYADLDKANTEFYVSNGSYVFINDKLMLAWAILVGFVLWLYSIFRDD